MFREKKLNSLVKEQLDRIIFKELDILPGILLTITRIECSTNGKLAKVYVSVLPDEKFEEVFAFLKRHTKKVQYLLMKSLRIQPIPTINFVEEKTVKEAAKIEKLLEKIRKEEKNEEKE
ncbi:MAG: 30S ribosome-binding factor RbfA [Candidatus Paceibacterota bacterium]